MHSAPDSTRAWLFFRRAFLWTLAAFALLWSLRAEAADGPTLVDAPSDPPVPPAAAPAENPPLPSAVEPAALPAYEAESPTEDPSLPHYGTSSTHFPQDNWTVTIVPNQPTIAEINRRRYEEAYASIPYRRAEYLANPGYRHEAALELMFGHLRPKTVVSHYRPQVVPTPEYSPYKPYRYSQTELQRWYPSNAPFSFGFPVGAYYPTYPRLPMLY